ncbi:MAG: ORF6N domain-containing protein [Chitinophagaceae bacterium]|nr:ORF6N domain-containing protein [Chitinophagaceae bacterium]MCA6453024.1 ORF6N domain-containing protein [Chitinophagaceae bacterium]MCA6456100.1 ORF6N domain-containing protein [Chitinophagaceae bacterium]MCA6458130.1 ORF6N domain-containing protein [Chitinophagaceae bacterium]MCA6463843.1 ORF6N domain-containing protein [Chitinophagaceae bacterium]
MDIELIQQKIFLVRGHRVMMDFDLANLYQVEPRRLKEAVRRNIRRFPPDFMYELTENEYKSLRSQFATLKIGRRGAHSKYLPFAFTEQGIAMLSGVLHSDTAIDMRISIMRAFINMRRFLFQYNELAEQVHAIKESVSNHNEQLAQIYDAIENLLDEKQEQNNWEERERIGFRP